MYVSTAQITTVSSNLCVARFAHNSTAVECNEYLLFRACMMRWEILHLDLGWKELNVVLVVTTIFPERQFRCMLY